MAGKDVTIIDGSLDFSGGVNSYVVPTVASERNPNGLKRNQVSWMVNGTVRGGGITQRSGFQKLGTLPAGAVGLFQGAFMYEPDSEYPYLIAAIGGHIWKIDPDNPSAAVDLSMLFVDQVTNYVVTDTVMVTLKQTSAQAADSMFIVGPQGTSPIKNFGSFVNPGNGNNVRVPLLQIITEPLGTVVTLGAFTGTIEAYEGYVDSGVINSGMVNPATIDRYFFCQAEQFLVIQAGDLVTFPLIWDGVILRRSLGLSGAGQLPSTNGYGHGNWYDTTTHWVVPSTFTGYVTFTLTTPYTGSVGDYLCTFASSTTQGGIITNFSFASSTWIVNNIAGNQITLRLIGNQAPYATGTNALGAAFGRLYFVAATPQSGAGATTGTPEIPPATAMDYYMGRLWYAQGRQYAAGDIVGNQSSGTVGYNFRDSVLKVTENPLCIGGDGFTVPTNAGNIRAIKHSANINTQLGEGQLYIFTRRSVYSLTVPVTRTDWIGADNNNQPKQTVVQITNGSVNDRSVVEQNGDLFFQSFEPSIRSLVLAVRYFDQWGNTPISINENRILKYNDRGLMQFASGVCFNNRMLQTMLPYECPVGTAFRSIIPLNFDVVSTLETKLPPVWEGSLEGIDILQLATGDFGGVQRCMAFVWSNANRELQMWEITESDRFENGDNRVIWSVEFPAFTWGDEFSLKKLVSAELWFDRLFGEVMFSADYRVDGDPCWYKWAEWKHCTARNSSEYTGGDGSVYPTEYCESFVQTDTLPFPPVTCVKQTGRPSNVGFQFQLRLTIKGFCRIRGVLLKAEKVQNQLYGRDMVC